MTWTSIHASVHRTIRARALFQKGQSLLVAVSGGQDSLCLMQLLLDLQPKWNWVLAIAHCNHRWRSDSSANADYIEQLAQRWQVPYFGAVAIAPPTSEAAARDWRYEKLTEIAQEQGYSAIVTGHTASDRAETLLYNLIRGSGADGLQALAWQRELHAGLQLVRPLLEITRTQTAQFCETAQLQPTRICATLATAFVKSCCPTSKHTSTLKSSKPYLRRQSYCEAISITWKQPLLPCDSKQPHQSFFAPTSPLRQKNLLSIDSTDWC
jgi:tRNA(Ile)-lysidine synthetase-like protein